MPKNIIIFSDGTGQRAGLTFDERRSNIYKLFRATRCGPDTTINPAEQVTFYDAGIGTASPGAGRLGRYSNSIYNKICQATGLGLTTNLVETYAAIIREWEEGDRIFLFGFSRGAYTMRLLGGVLSLCGVPTKQPNGKDKDQPLRTDEKASKKIARRAVTRVYQHSASKADTPENPLTDEERKRLDQRRLLAEEFREQYGSSDKKDSTQSNTVPHFIGVFDTVASIAHPVATAIIVLFAFFAMIPLSALIAKVLSLWPYFFSFIGNDLSLLHECIFILASVVSCVVIARTFSKFPGAIGKYSWLQTARITGYMHFEDTDLSERVRYARHAISIDENRAQFQRVKWDRKGAENEPDEYGIIPFKQFWFAGVHTDIGGGYPETESRLSDAALEWMLEDVQKEGIGLRINPIILNLFTQPHGRQHDEYEANWFWKLAGKKIRDVPNDAPLHPSVESRYRAAKVRHFDAVRPYRPTNLENHRDVIAWNKSMTEDGGSGTS